MMHVDVVALEVGPDPLIEGLAQRATAVHEPVDGQRAIVGQVQAVEVALLEPGQVQRRLSHRLGGDSGVRHGAAIVRSLLDERDLLAEVRRLRGALLPGWARTDHDQVVGGAFHVPASRCRLDPQFSATLPRNGSASLSAEIGESEAYFRALQWRSPEREPITTIQAARLAHRPPRGPTEQRAVSEITPPTRRAGLADPLAGPYARRDGFARDTLPVRTARLLGLALAEREGSDEPHSLTAACRTTNTNPGSRQRN